jgi:methanethiol S-methyltransferase
MTTAYILVAIRFEEHDLMAIHGEKYRRYRDQVPMLIPSPSASVTVAGPASRHTTA